MKKALQVFSFTLFIALCTTQAFAESLKIITIALPPYGYIEKHEEPGLAYEIANLIAKTAGYSPDNTVAPLSRAVNDLTTGIADITIMLPSPETAKGATDLGRVLTIESVVIGRADTPMRSLRELKGKTIAGVRGARYDERICKCNGIATYPTKDYEQSLKMLMAKRVDGVVGPKLGILHTAKEMKLPKRAFGKPLVLASVDAVLLLSKKTSTPEKQRRLENALNALLKDGTIKSLLEKYSL